MSELIIVERSDIVAVADAVRNKTGKTDEMTLGQMIDDINSIEGNIILSVISVTDDGEGNVMINSKGGEL